MTLADDRDMGSDPARLKLKATLAAGADRIAAVLQRARESGLISAKGGRIAGRVSPALIEQAKARTGIRSDSALVEFALANIAIEDDFARAFRELKGTVDPTLDLGN